MAASIASAVWGGLALAQPLTSGTREPRELIVEVRNALDEQPLQNAEVRVLGSELRRFTNSVGVARLQLEPSPSLVIRVRMLGFTFHDVMPWGSAGAEVGDTIRVRLARIPFALPSVRTRASAACDGVSPSEAALETWALEQLREGAERYEAFRKLNPFNVVLSRRTIREPGTSRAQLRDTRESTHSGDWGEVYRRGDVVRQLPLGFSVPILFVATLGEPSFWDHHCAIEAAVEGDSTQRVVRLRFGPGNTITGTDWLGEAVLDSATSMLRRVDFKLRIRGNPGPTRFEGYTTFKEASPFILVPDTTIAYWWRRPAPADTAWGLPDVVQRVVLEELKFRRPPR